MFRSGVYGLVTFFKVRPGSRCRCISRGTGS